METSNVPVLIPEETVPDYREQLSEIISRQEVIASCQLEISADVANMEHISQYSFVILLIAIVCAVIAKTFFHGGY